jgi:uncharacterized membrane protein YfcA
MDLYLPIANLPVNMLVIIGLGGLVGLLSGMFGVGGGFLTTPLLIFYGIPPTVAAASATTQVTERASLACLRICRAVRSICAWAGFWSLAAWWAQSWAQDYSTCSRRSGRPIR